MARGIWNVSWPVLRFGVPECTFIRYNDQGEVCKATIASIPFLQGMDEYFLVDTDGKKLALTKPQLEKPPSVFGRLIAVFLNRVYTVTWETSDQGVVSVGELRGMIMKNFSQYPGYWEAYDLETLKSEVQEAQSPKELIQLF